MNARASHWADAPSLTHRDLREACGVSKSYLDQLANRGLFPMARDRNKYSLRDLGHLYLMKDLLRCAAAMDLGNVNGVNSGILRRCRPARRAHHGDSSDRSG
jgi:hypothetical protein